jgi:AcrR family transcriptional regulator
MTYPIERRRLGRPTQTESLELVERLREAALGLFLDRGFDATTMDAVARQASITRRTLYARYPDKHALFVEVVTWARTRHPWLEPDFHVDLSDLRGALTAIARAAVARAIQPEVVSLDRLVINEWRRFPQLVIYGRSHPLSPRMQLVMDLLSWHEDRGNIQVDDLEITAEQFLAMVSMMPARLAAVGVHRAPDVEEAHIEHAVTLFIRGLTLTRL